MAISPILRPAFSPPEVVYHYTNIDTMMKIVGGACIWATSIKYLNDISEGEHYLRLIRGRIESYKSSPQAADLSIFGEFLNRPNPGFQNLPFIASFSQQDDSLSQWRSYCPAGNGVAIGFSVDCLEHSQVVQLDPASLPQTTFQKVDYIDASRTETLDQDIAAAIAEAKNIAGSYYSQAAVFFNLIIKQRASFKKAPSFSSEDEYRLVVDGIFYDHRYFGYRTTRSTLVPFVPVKIPERRSNYDPSEDDQASPKRSQFVDRVVIGPTANPELSRDSVDSFFRKHGVQIEVASSSVPYRDW